MKKKKSFFPDDSDLNLKIGTSDFCCVKAVSKDGFGYMWAGVRSTHGVVKGRVCFEVRIDGNQPTNHLEEEETPNALRVGWYEKAFLPDTVPVPVVHI